MTGAIIDECDAIIPIADSSDGRWYGPSTSDYGDRGPIHLGTEGGDTHLYVTLSSAYYQYPMRRIGTIDTSEQKWIGIEWKLVRADPAREGSWNKIDLMGSSSGHIYAYNIYGVPLEQMSRNYIGDGWMRWWFEIPGSAIYEPGFQFRASGMDSGDKFMVRKVLRAASIDETNFVRTIQINRPDRELTNQEVEKYYPEGGWPTNPRRAAVWEDSYTPPGFTYEVGNYLALYASYERARRITPVNTKTVALGRVSETSVGRSLTPTPARVETINRVFDNEVARVLSPPAELRKTREAEAARPLTRVLGRTLNQAVETNTASGVFQIRSLFIPASAGLLMMAVTDLPEEASSTFLYITDPVVPQAPGTLLVNIASGAAGSTVSAIYEGAELARVVLTSDGSGLLSIPVTAEVNGGVGNHIIEIAEVLPNGTIGLVEPVTYSVAAPPAVLPAPVAPDPVPVPVPESTVTTVRKWVFQDPAVNGLGSWVLPINPREMTSPHFEHALTSKHTTSREGRFHIFQAGMLPKEWVFGGYCPTEEMAEKLWAFRNINRRIYVIDHHGRAWKVAITHLDIVPRLRHVYNGQVSDWGSDWSMTVTILDQEPTLVT